MDKHIQSKLEMYQRVYDVLTENAIAWQDKIAFVQMVNNLNENIAKLKEQSSNQAEPIIGITRTKRSRRTELNNLAHYSASLLTAYSMATNNSQLHVDHSRNHSSLVNMRDMEFQLYVKRLLSDLELHFDALSDYGISEESLNELKVAYLNWCSLIAEPRQAINARKRAGFVLRELVKTTDALLYNGLDKVMVPFKGSIPVFYFQYRSARKLLESYRHKNRNKK